MVDRLLEGRVAIVTGAGGGLGRAHALALASHGAKVVVNDMGSARDGAGSSMDAAEQVVAEIVSGGGEAFANGADVTSEAQVAVMVAEATRRWGGIDILVNNAGILRDRTFAKMDLSDFRKVVDVHLMGAVHCTKAVWDDMRDRRYGRIVFTTSSSGLFGNFGQANYGAAKMALVGLMQTLRLEGAKYGIHVNCLSPSAATRMTGDIMEDEKLAALDPAKVSPAVVALAAETAPNGAIVCAGAGHFGAAHITLTSGRTLRGANVAEDLLSQWDDVTDRSKAFIPAHGPDQAAWEYEVAMRQCQANTAQT
jgi:NAD(P)-dependent dehydrogenase (short-subunit alcohol dehydrogenase family)